MRTLWIILGLYLLWRIGTRIFAVRKFIKQQRDQNFQDPQQRSKEGEVNIIGRRNEQKPKSEDKGDYVDYEEV